MFPSDHRAWRRVRIGAISGLFVATAFTLLASIARVANGEAVFDKSVFTYPRIVLFYYIAGVIVGSLGGVLAPRAKTFRGALWVGWLLGCIVFALLLAIANFTERFSPTEAMGLILILGAALGIPCTLAFRHSYLRKMSGHAG